MLVIACLLNQTQNLNPGNLPCLVIFEPPPLLVMFKAQLAFLIMDVKPLLQNRSNVDWLSNRRIHLKSRSSDLLDFRASEILGYDSSRNSMAFWKWLEPSADDIDESLLSSSLHFWHALTISLTCGCPFPGISLFWKWISSFLLILHWQKISHHHHPLLLSCKH
jgi:hypothetical protein